MRSLLRRVMPLLGVVTSVSLHLIRDFYASGSGNARYQKGGFLNRYGWREVAALQSGFAAGYGLYYSKGLDGATVKEEYVSIEDISGTVRPYSIDVSSSVRTEIKDTTTQLSLHASQWRRVEYDKFAFFFNLNDTGGYKLSQHDVEDDAKWLGISAPAKPTTRLTAKFIKNVVTGADDVYAMMDWGTMVTGDFTRTGSAASVTSVDGKAEVTHTANSRLRTSVSADIDVAVRGPGVQDWTHNHVFHQLIWLKEPTSPFEIDIGSLEIVLTNVAEGTPFDMEVVSAQNTQLHGLYEVYFKFAQSVDRTLTDDIGAVKYTYEVIGSSSQSASNVLVLGEIKIGCIDPALLPQQLYGFIQFFYSYKNNTTGQESQMGFGIEVPVVHWEGERVTVGTITYPLGTLIELTAVGSAESGVDRWVLWSYYSMYGGGRQDPDLRTHGTFVDSGGTLVQKVPETYDEWLLLDSFTDSAPWIGDEDIVNAFVHNGSVWWLTDVGTKNIRISYVGTALRLFTETDGQTPDDVVGADLTLASDLTDKPLAGHSAGGSAILLGSRGAYVSTGVRPILQLTPYKLPESTGTAGPNSSAPWRDDNGVPAVVYLSANLDTVWMVRVLSAVDQEKGHDLLELSIDVRGAVKEWLFGTDTPTADQIYVWVDERADALWIAYKSKAVVHRRQTLLDGRRPWEFYDYAMDASETFGQFDSNPVHGTRLVRSTGELDELEYDSSDSSKPIEGLLRDDGKEMLESYWESKDFMDAHGRRTRVIDVRMVRADLADRHTLQITSTEKTSAAIAVGSGEQFVRFGADQAGYEHRLKVVAPEGSGEFRGFEVREAVIDPRRHL